ncbi:MAG TPA: sulfotransferase [Candidatus Omnitrophota bacterium]|nr:sulfotransferase [Candidatus Omnitrophota bacterium]
MKIFGIGLAKTGTYSLRKALEILGFKTLHFSLDPEKDLERFEAFCDMPFQTRYPEYDKKYPKSKFILTVRDKNAWLRSCKKYFSRKKVFSETEKDVLLKYRAEQFGAHFFDKKKFAMAYEAHVQDVKKYFKGREKDLLFLNICGGEGWEVLCPFLGKKIPEAAFPHENISGPAGPLELFFCQVRNKTLQALENLREKKNKKQKHYEEHCL